VILRRDHVAGGAFVVAGVLILAVSHDLPFGTLASPGAGMLPVLVIGLMMLFGLILVIGAGASPPIADIAWGDLPHALRVVAVCAVAVALYTKLGFIVTMSLMMFCLLFVVEGIKLWRALAFSVAIPLLTYVMFEHVLKTPLEAGIFRF
jgi:hypothetical protein